MILMTTYATGEIPFRTVYLHGLILDKLGRKMSKSHPETCVDPLDTVEEYGADVLRLSLLVGNAPGKDMKLGKERLVGGKRLINKIWNAAKLVDASVKRTVPDRDRATLRPDAVEHPVNRWMLMRLADVVDRVSGRIDAYLFGDAAEVLRQSFWGEFCDFYLEAIKVPPLADSEETAEVLFHSFTTYLKLFHPFLPFVTECLWGEVVKDGLLINATWPEVDRRWDDPAESAGVDAVMRLVAAVRGVRSEQELDPGVKVEVSVRAGDHRAALESSRAIIERLVRAEKLTFEDPSTPSPEGAAVAVDPAFEVAVQLGEADRAAERERLEKQLEESKKHLARLEKQLANENFVTRAKPEAVEKVRAEHARQTATVAAIEERLG
jgi:valyl-tRNA synthetase